MGGSVESEVLRRICVCGGVIAGFGEFVSHALAGRLPNTWAPHGNLAVEDAVLMSWSAGLSALWSHQFRHHKSIPAFLWRVRVEVAQPSPVGSPPALWVVQSKHTPQS